MDAIENDVAAEARASELERSVSSHNLRAKSAVGNGLPVECDERIGNVRFEFGAGCMDEACDLADEHVAVDRAIVRLRRDRSTSANGDVFERLFGLDRFRFHVGVFHVSFGKTRRDRNVDGFAESAAGAKTHAPEMFARDGDAVDLENTKERALADVVETTMKDLGEVP